jgi:hypothetical protein
MHKIKGNQKDKPSRFRQNSQCACSNVSAALEDKNWGSSLEMQQYKSEGRIKKEQNI